MRAGRPADAHRLESMMIDPDADDPDSAFRFSHEDMMPLVEVAHGTRIMQHVFEALGAPVPGSFLGPGLDGRPPLPQMNDWCAGYLDAAIDHLLLWADYAVPLKFHPEATVTFALRPALTLARAAMESAAQTVWILAAPDNETTAKRFFALGLADTIEQAKATPPAPGKDELVAERDILCEKMGVTPRPSKRRCTSIWFATRLRSGQTPRMTTRSTTPRIA